ncbi:MAG: RNA polymerase sigma factor [Armatimonadetes bacterium]|nr:RNA polymerase sigma factor [Armatimonadota bacterium]
MTGRPLVGTPLPTRDMLHSPAKKESAAIVLERELEVLYRVARRMTLNDADAEDIVSQTLLNAFKHWDDFDGKHPRSWLIRILNNEWLYLLRKRKVRSEVDMEATTEPADENFWKVIDVQMDVKDVVNAVDELPEEYRVAVTLCDLEEMTYESAADVLGVPIGTIRSRVFRGRRILRHKLVGIYQS